MKLTCTRCNREIEDAEPRYTRQSPETGPDHFCSLNCIADTDDHDERAVRSTLFETAPAE